MNFPPRKRIPIPLPLKQMFRREIDGTLRPPGSKTGNLPDTSSICRNQKNGVVDRTRTGDLLGHNQAL